MQVIAFNGSPRKTWNTATLLQKALEGAASKGATTRMVHLYDLDFQGCRSCFGCKIRGGPSHGRCAIKDDLTPILEEVKVADAIVLGSPVYFWAVTGEMKSFMERLMFPFYLYRKDSDPHRTLFPRTIHSGFIYTMNAAEERFKEVGFEKQISNNEIFMSMIFGRVESLVCMDTLQFEDYSKIDQDRYDPVAKVSAHQERFPQDCMKAFAMGARFATPR